MLIKMVGQNWSICKLVGGSILITFSIHFRSFIFCGKIYYHYISMFRNFFLSKCYIQNSSIWWGNFDHFLIKHTKALWFFKQNFLCTCFSSDKHLRLNYLTCIFGQVMNNIFCLMNIFLIWKNNHRNLIEFDREIV